MLKQLKLDYDLGVIIEEDYKYINISKKIYDYSLNLISNFMFMDNNKKYCSYCLNELNSDICTNKYCHNYNRIINKNHIVETDIKDIRNYEDTRYLLEFEIINDSKIYLNRYEINIYYDNELIIKPRLLFDIKKINKYQIYKQGLYDIFSDRFILYQDMSKYDNMEDNMQTCLYINNIEDLKNTDLYKYTNIWDMKSILSVFASIYEITYRPIYIKEFEYLTKMKLYNLALDSDIKFKNNFKDTFGVDKKYLPFMVKCNITNDMLEAFKLYKIQDRNILELISYNLDIFKCMKDIKSVINYIKNNIKNDNYKIEFYLEYLYICKDLKLDLFNKQIICPKNLKKSYEDVHIQYELSKNKKILKQMNSIYEILKINSYEDDNYIIRPAEDYEDLIDESYQMNNCVRSYYEKIIYSNSNIYFLRKKDNPNKSFVTIEVEHNKIVQAYEKYNKPIRKEIIDLLRKWESNLIKIE